MNKKILVIDDNRTICVMLKSWLIKKGFDVDIALHAKKARVMVKETPYDLILSDIRMPDMDGFAFLEWVNKYDSDILVIMMTSFAGIESAVEAMKLGAVDYISKPIDPEKLFNKIDEAFQLQENTKKNNKFNNKFITPPGKEYKQLFEKLDNIAENNLHQLIIGDRGTGKSSAVKYIYEKGIHPSKPLILLDATDVVYKNSRHTTDSVKSMLIEKFQEAEGGLLYISEIDQFDKLMQNDLLKMLTRQKKDENFTQIVLSSEANLESLQFALIPKLYNLIEDDYVVLPSLKGKKEQIIFFATYFIEYANYILNKNIKSIDPVIQKQFIEYEWPGNIQELKNSIIKAVLLTEGSEIKADISDELFGAGKIKNKSQLITKTDVKSLRKENYEKEKISQALELAKGNKTMAASILNIDRKTLYNKIKLYDVRV